MGRLFGIGAIAVALGAAGGVLAQPVAMDQAMAPLVVRAEADLAVGAFAMARARAAAVLSRVSGGSGVAARARAVRDSAAARAEGQPEPAADLVWEPIVVEAEGDAAAGRGALATARLNAALSALPSDSALAGRARNLLVLAGRGSGTGTGTGAATGGSSGQGVAGDFGVSTNLPPPPVQPPPPPIQPPPPPGIVLGAPPGPPQSTFEPVPAGTGGTVLPQTIEPVTDETRTGAELAELHAGAISFGFLLGSWTLYLAGGRDPLLFGTIPFLGSVGLSLAVTALDRDAMPAGVPSSISTGMGAGFLNGLIAWGALESELAVCEPTMPFDGRTICSTDGVAVMSLLVGSTILGTLGGGLVGYGLRPTVADNRFVASGALWGGMIGLFTALGLEWDLDRDAWQMTSVGLNAGLAIAVLAASVADFRMERVSWVSAFGLFGMLTASMIAGMIYAGWINEEDGPGPELMMGSLAIGASAGLLLGLAMPIENRR
jgi:hypothetical protein